MKIVTKRQVIREAKARWLEQRAGVADSVVAHWARPRTIGSLRQALNALDIETCSEADFDAAIGRAGWCSLECDECGTKAQSLIRFGQDPDYEARWWDVCYNCLVTAASLKSS